MKPDQPELLLQYENLIHALSGAGGGMISMAITYPLITIGTRMQVQKSPKKKAASKRSSRRDYANLFDAIWKIYTFEGFRGFYAGLSSALFGIALTNGCYYFWYEWTKGFFLQQHRTAIKSAANHRGLTIMESLLAGAIAGAFTVFMTNPVWVINTRITTGKKSMEDDAASTTTSPPSSAAESPAQLRRRSKQQNGDERESVSPTRKQSMYRETPPSAWEMLKSIVKEEGVGSLWQGVMPALILVSNPSIQYMVFEQLKNALEQSRAQRGLRLHNSDFFVLGAMSKLVATFLTYPYIVVKSRMQLALRRRSASSSPRKNSAASPTDASTNESRAPSAYASTTTAFMQILKEEGFAGLYRGLGSKLLQSVLTAAILFWAKEVLVGWAKTLVLYVLARRGVIPATATR